jgi:hypothetical protein
MGRCLDLRGYKVSIVLAVDEMYCLRLLLDRLVPRSQLTINPIIVLVLTLPHHLKHIFQLRSVSILSTLKLLVAHFDDRTNVLRVV